jgi:hypothetical protein
MIGQFSQYINSEDGIVLFLINPYRPWSRDLPGIAETISRIIKATRAAKLNIVSNPNFGLETTAEDIVAGNEKLRAMLSGQLPILFVCALERLCGELQDKISEPLIPVNINILYPWQEA